MKTNLTSTKPSNAHISPAPFGDNPKRQDGTGNLLSGLGFSLSRLPPHYAVIALCVVVVGIIAYAAINSSVETARQQAVAFQTMAKAIAPDKVAEPYSDELARGSPPIMRREK